MIKLKIGRSGPDTHVEAGANSLHSASGTEENMESPADGRNTAAGNNVESLDDEGHGSDDQEQAIGGSGDQDVQQRRSQQEHGDSTDPDSTAKGASGHRSGAPGGASSDKDSNVSTEAGNTAGRGPRKDPGALKDQHSGMSLDEEAKERLTSEGGPPPKSDTGTRRGDLDAPITERTGGYSPINNGHQPGRH